MTTDKQARAHQRNAQFSTGLRLTQGDATSSRNALRLGMWASAGILLEGEDPQQWAALHDGLWQTLAPVGALEEVLVTRIVTTVWRIRRIERVESSLYVLGSETARLANETGALFLARVGGSGPGSGPLSHAVLEGQAWMRMSMDPDVWTGLARCEGALERILYRALSELAARQRARTRRADPDAATPDALPALLRESDR